MSISPQKYVNIVSGVGAAANVPTRDLVGRFFTGNLLLPPGTFIEFSSAAAVTAFFGAASEESARAIFYFSFVSKTLVQPATIQFARWTSTAVAPRIQSVANNNAVLANFSSVTNGSIGLTINGTVGTFTGIDFTLLPVTDLTDVATVLTTAIAATFTGSTVTYDGNGGFVFTGGTTGAATISVQGGLGGTDLTTVGHTGWLPAATFTNGVYTPGAITSNGSAAETITKTLTDSAALSNNFGSFLFLNNLNLSLANAVLAATWNQTENNSYLFCAPVTSSNYAAWTDDSTGLGLLGGTALTLSGASVAFTGIVTSASAVITGLPSTAALNIGMPVSGTNIPAGSVIVSIAAAPSTDVTISHAATGSGSEVITFMFNQYPEQIPMMVEAATDYYAINSVQNYMFQGPFASLFPLVSTDTLKEQYDAVSVNYYGNTQQAGVPLNFYQTGVLQGASPSPLDMTSYVNEIWLKDAITSQILNLFISSSQIPANALGRAQILASLQEIINQALVNGTISVNKQLTTQQQTFITAQTGDPDAWYQVQSIGYWVDCAIVASGSPLVYSATYTLIYSKDDVIRLVEGQDILI